MRAIITTSRSPSRRTRSLTRELAALIPGSVRVNRGHMSMEELAAFARSIGAKKIIMIWERKGNPGVIKVFQVEEKLTEVFSIKIKGVALSRELGRELPRPVKCVSAKGDTEEARGLAAALFSHAGGGGRDLRRCVEASIEKRDGELRLLFLLDGRLVGPEIRFLASQEVSNPF